MTMVLAPWVEQAYALGASDLHLESGTPVVVRVRGELRALGATASADVVRRATEELLGAEGERLLGERGSVDLSCPIGGVRCRVNVFLTWRGRALALRLLTPVIKDLRACNLHPDLRKLVEAPSGLVILCGPTGSGKSTTLAALLEELNANSARHIVTLESPIEYLFANRQSYIRQREIPTHAPTFEQGITDALRENPDVLAITEMRSPEVMRLGLDAAETGHLVIATLHSASCAEALTRICMSFPAEAQSSVRAQLADCLVAVCCQRLEFIPAHRVRVPRCEILLATSAARGALRTGNLSQIANIIQAGGEEGLWTFDRYQRWMDQVSNWVQPPTAAPALEPAPDLREGVARGSPGLTRTPIAAGSERAAEGGSRIAPREGGRAAATAPRTGAPRPAGPSPRSAPPGEEVIEVPAEDLDLASLAELAKRVVERKPP